MKRSLPGRPGGRKRLDPVGMPYRARDLDNRYPVNRLCTSFRRLTVGGVYTQRKKDVCALIDQGDPFERYLSLFSLSYVALRALTLQPAPMACELQLI